MFHCHCHCPGSMMSLIDGKSSSNPQEYHNVLGALQYIFLACLDTFYSSNQVCQFSRHSANRICQFLHAPTLTHLQAVKYILQYSNSTIGTGITFHSGRLNPHDCLFRCCLVGCLTNSSLHIVPSWNHILSHGEIKRSPVFCSIVDANVYPSLLQSCRCYNCLFKGTVLVKSPLVVHSDNLAQSTHLSRVNPIELTLD